MNFKGIGKVSTGGFRQGIDMLDFHRKLSLVVLCRAEDEKRGNQAGVWVTKGWGVSDVGEV